MNLVIQMYFIRLDIFTSCHMLEINYQDLEKRENILTTTIYSIITISSAIDRSGLTQRCHRFTEPRGLIFEHSERKTLPIRKRTIIYDIIQHSFIEHFKNS